MSPPSLGVEEEARGISQNNLGLTERNYLGLSSCSSVDSSALSSVSEVNKSNLNLKATELRLGLPGSLSPGRDSEPNELTIGTFEEKTLFPLLPSKEQKNATSGNKRVFSATPTNVKTSNNSASAPPAKTQVVGWPPIRSYRKNTLATSSKNNEEVDGKPGASGLFVKVSMDGAPYLRKVDLRLYATYRELSSALEKMFSCFTLGQCGSNGTPGKEMSEIKMKDLLHGSEYVVTYEDKDGDWMLVGDVPWDMFIESCKRLKIMKGADAIGLAPRASEKSKNKV